MTVTIVKVKGNNENIIHLNEFIDNAKNYILSRVLNERKAIYNANFYDPSFGIGDLEIFHKIIIKIII